MADKIYTEEYVLEQVEILLKELHDNPDYIYIGELFEDKDYTRKRYNEWLTIPREDRVSRYWDNEEIASMSSTIKEILETRAVKWLLKNELNPTWTIFHLKNNYKWVDKQVTENTNTNLGYEVDDSDEFKNILKSNWLI